MNDYAWKTDAWGDATLAVDSWGRGAVMPTYEEVLAAAKFDAPGQDDSENMVVVNNAGPNATLTGGKTTAQVSVDGPDYKFPKALRFDGSGDLVVGDSDGMMRGVSRASIACRFRCDAAHANQGVPIFGLYRNGSNTLFRIGIAIATNGRVYAGGRSLDSDNFQSSGNSTTNCADGAWHDLVAHVDYLAKTLKLWVDGVLEASISGLSFGGDTTSDTELHSITVGSGHVYKLACDVANPVALESLALTPEIYAQGPAPTWEGLITDPDLIAHWNGDANGDGTGDADDAAGSFDGTWSGTAAYANAQNIGKTFDFDGSSGIDGATGGGVELGIPATTGAFSKTCTFVPETVSGFQVLFKSGGATHGQGIALDGTDLVATLTTNGTARTARLADVAEIGKRVFALAVFDLDGDLSLRCDAVEGVATTDLTSASRVSSGTDPCSLGFAANSWRKPDQSDVNSDDYYFTGTIEDVRIYSRALNAAEYAVLAAGPNASATDIIDNLLPHPARGVSSNCAGHCTDISPALTGLFS